MLKINPGLIVSRGESHSNDANGRSGAGPEIFYLNSNSVSSPDDGCIGQNISYND